MEVLDLGTAPGVDGLILVADNGQGPPSLRHELDDIVLDRVGVLKLYANVCQMSHAWTSEGTFLYLVDEHMLHSADCAWVDS